MSIRQFNEYTLIRSKVLIPAPYAPQSQLKQSGIALVTALLFLLVVTILGVSSLRNNVLNEKMTRNIIVRQQAFEAAEVALLRGEADVRAFGTLIATKVGNGFISEPADRVLAENCEIQFGSGRGICAPVEYYQNYLAETPYDHWVDRPASDSRDRLDVWNTPTRHRRVSNAVRNRLDLDENPRYIIEFLGYIPPQGVDAACPSGATSLLDEAAVYPFCRNDKKSFRVTALGIAGSRNEARVILQSVYVID